YLGAPARCALRPAVAAAAARAEREAVALLLLTGTLLGRGVTRLVPADVLAVLTALPAGRTVPAVLALLAAAALLALGAARARAALPARAALVVALAAVVLPVATTGHPAAAGDHVLTVVVLAVHVVAASLWVGGLVGVLLHVGGAGPARAVAVGRLSRLALACVVAVTGTGVAGALLVTDLPVRELLGTGYGALLLAKTAGVVVLVAVGWAHRRRTLPLLQAGRPGAFVRLAVAEAALLAGVLALAVGLAASPPPAGSATSSAAPSLAADAQTPPAASAPAAPDPAAPGGPAAPGDPVDGVPAAPVAPAAPVDPSAPVAPAAPPAEDMSGHDHGPLQVSVLVDADRLHLGAPVTAGVPVTVYSTSPDAVELRADDGSFVATVPSRTFITFPAPDWPGAYRFGDPDDVRYRDVLQVLPAP
ncbi:CopD family protein, partial [Aquipuribacter hungaricus]|uniref:CopD family protein n=1 Tax=Aquipuribacter hungaricus TaxID=545624 RepID=UPI003620C512